MSRHEFGVGFFLHLQAGALVHIYTDGSVLLTHGGTEMGQGLHTKMVQVPELNNIVAVFKSCLFFKIVNSFIVSFSNFNAVSGELGINRKT